MAIAPSGPRLLGLGDNTVDTYVDRGMQYPGGNAVNVAVLAHRLGLTTEYLGCLGDDETGDLIATALRDEGVPMPRTRRIAGGANARAFIKHDNGDRRFLKGFPGVRGRYDLGADDLAYIARFDAVHTSVFSELDGALPTLRPNLRALSYDLSERWTDETLARVAPWIDTAFLSAPNRGDAEVEALLRRVTAMGPRAAIATRGAAGSMALIGGRILHQGILPATIVDTLGAGDGFIAGFLVATLRGAEPAAALEAGAGYAAMVCGWEGAFGRGAPWQA